MPGEQALPGHSPLPQKNLLASDPPYDIKGQYNQSGNRKEDNVCPDGGPPNGFLALRPGSILGLKNHHRRVLSKVHPALLTFSALYRPRRPRKWRLPPRRARKPLVCMRKDWRNCRLMKLWLPGICWRRRSQPIPTSHSRTPLWRRLGPSLGYDKKAEEEAKKAFDLSGNLTRGQHLSVEGRYREYAQDFSAAIEIYRTLRNFFPDNLDYALRLASAQRKAGHPKDSLETIAQVRACPSP